MSLKLTRIAYAFLLIKVKHHASRAVVFDLLIALALVVGCAVTLRRRIEEIVALIALVIDTLGLGHIYDDR